MSFDVNFNKNLSNVQASSKTTQGGAGNTGYFSRNGEEQEENIGFSKEYPEDSFEKSGTLDEIQNQSFWTIIKNLFLDILEAIKNFFTK